MGSLPVHISSPFTLATCLCFSHFNYKGDSSLKILGCLPTAHSLLPVRLLEMSIEPTKLCCIQASKSTVHHTEVAHIYENSILMEIHSNLFKSLRCQRLDNSLTLKHNLF